MKMRIGIDASCLSRNFPSGVKNYTANLIKELSNIDKHNEYYIYSSDDRLLPKQNNINFIYIPKIPIIGRQIILPLRVAFQNLDIFHFPEPYGSVLLKSSKIITTVHDIDLDIVYPRGVKYSLKKIYSLILRRATLKHSSVFITSSNTTNRDLNKHFGMFTKGKKVSTVYLAGWNERLFYRKRKERDYLLCFGDFSPRKNVDLIIRSYHALREDYKIKHALYIVVSTRQTFEAYNIKVRNLGLSNYIKLILAPNSSELKNLYKNALVFIYPSLYEGFGIPILEAMACGCPVITTRYGSMREVAKESALLINPRSMKSLNAAILKITNDTKLRKTLVKKGLARARDFSWKKTAQEVLKIYSNTISL